RSRAAARASPFMRAVSLASARDSGSSSGTRSASDVTGPEWSRPDETSMRANPPYHRAHAVRRSAAHLPAQSPGHPLRGRVGHDAAADGAVALAQPERRAQLGHRHRARRTRRRHCRRVPRAGSGGAGAGRLRAGRRLDGQDPRVLAHEALRPVGRMTAEADTISLAEPGRRLRQPPGYDEIARLGRTLNTMLGRMEASFAREKAFVDDASHELRTPISILRGELELALAQPGSREDTERTLRSALEEAERLGRLAEDLLVLARSTSGDLPLRRDRVDAYAVAE